MSTIKSSESNLILEADGSGNDIKFQANGVEKASIDASGNLTVTGAVTADNLTVNGTGTSNFTSTATSPIQINGTSIPTLTVRNSATPVELQMRATTTEGLVRTATNHPLAFGVNASEKMRIDSSGNVAIGHTSTTGSKFAICDGANSQIQFFPEISTDTNLTQHYDPTAAAYINAETRASTHSFKIGTANAMSIHSTGGVSVGTGTSIGSGNILVNEGIYISSSNGDYQIRGNSTGGGSATLYIGNKSIDTTASDARFKDVIGDCTNGLEIVKSLKVKDYTWKEGFDNDTTTVMSGLLAQEVELIDPSLVTKPTPKEAVEAVEEVRDADGNITTEAVKAVEAVNASDEGWSVKYQMIVPKLIQAIQELEARITALEA